MCQLHWMRPNPMNPILAAIHCVYVHYMYILLLYSGPFISYTAALFSLKIVLTQLFKRLLHVQFSVDVAGVGWQQREVLTHRCVSVHLHIDAHCRQRLLGLKHCCDGRAIEQTDLWISGLKNGKVTSGLQKCWDERRKNTFQHVICCSFVSFLLHQYNLVMGWNCFPFPEKTHSIHRYIQWLKAFAWDENYHGNIY